MSGVWQPHAKRTDLKRITTITVVVVVALAGVAGLLAFALSFRPSHFRLQPGEALIYRIVTTSIELGKDGKDLRDAQPVRDERLLTLVGIAADNEIGYLAEEVKGREKAARLRIAEDGAAIPLDAAGRPTSGGRTIGVFDLNLFALPPSATEQSWETQISYGLLPAARQPVQVKVRRSQSKSNPEFQLKMPPALEWLDGGTYRQIRDLVCTYRFRTSRHAVETATIKCLWAVERPEGKRSFRLETTVELVEAKRVDGDIGRLHDAMVACASADAALTDPAIGPGRRQSLANELRSIDPGFDTVRKVADRLANEVLRQPAQRASPVAVRWLLQVAVGPGSLRSSAAALSQNLTDKGFPAHVEQVGASIRVVLGPFVEKSQDLIDRLDEAFPALKPLWVEAPAS